MSSRSSVGNAPNEAIVQTTVVVGVKGFVLTKTFSFVIAR